MTHQHLLQLTEPQVRHWVKRDIDEGEIDVLPYDGAVHIPPWAAPSLHEATAEGRRSLDRDGLVVGPQYFALAGDIFKIGQLGEIADLVLEPNGMVVIEPRQAFKKEILRITLPTIWHLLYAWDGDPEFLYP